MLVSPNISLKHGHVILFLALNDKKQVVGHLFFIIINSCGFYVLDSSSLNFQNMFYLLVLYTQLIVNYK